VARPVWIEPAPPRAGIRLHDDPLLHHLLADRVGSTEEAADFLDPRERPLPDPSRLPGMDAAVERIARALRHGERIALFGDYDADGVTSTAILTLALRAASGGKAPATTALPTRDQGYGLHGPAIEQFAAEGVTLLIAVDCGSGDHKLAARAQELGMDLVAIDHHELPPDGPAEGAFVASARLEANAPYRDLPAAGLALLASSALARLGFDVGDGAGADPRSLLDLAMIGVIADVCQLTGLNRGLVRDGLRLARRSPRPGLRALAAALGIDHRALDSRAVSRQIAPVLNAPGRRDDPRPALDLLLAPDPLAANRWVVEAMAARTWARSARVALVERELAALGADLDLDRRAVVLVAMEDCPQGLAGLVSIELVKALGRPAVVLARHRDGNEFRGSARSVEGFDIGGALQEISHLLIRTGGHTQAAGLAVEADRIGDVREALEAVAAQRGLAPAKPPELRLDAEIRPERVALATVKLLDELRPFGVGNEDPLLLVRGAQVREARTMGEGGKHLKIGLAGPGGANAVLWGQGTRLREIGPRARIDLAGRLGRNAWNGRTEPQMILEDFRPADGGEPLR
jgi:single-stranded-DNA-specific exonuclease